MAKRLLTAFFLICAITATLLWAPVWLFKIFVLALIVAALREFYKLVLPNDYFSMIIGIIFGLVFSVMLVFSLYLDFALPIIITAVFILIMSYMVYSTTMEGAVSRIGLILFGTIYICFTLPAFVWLRESDHGRSLIVFTIAIVALGDTFAYSVGKLIGRKKLSPLISPNKTWEGFIASFFGGVAASLICWQFFWKALPVWLIVFLGLSVALIGALGDLVESMIKRAYHVKDSGNILPGHGGILDRVDALIFAAPFVFFTFRILGWI